MIKENRSYNELRISDIERFGFFAVDKNMHRINPNTVTNNKETGWVSSECKIHIIYFRNGSYLKYIKINDIFSPTYEVAVKNNGNRSN